jgi:hypothetical protein
LTSSPHRSPSQALYWTSVPFALNPRGDAAKVGILGTLPQPRTETRPPPETPHAELAKAATELVDAAVDPATDIATAAAFLAHCATLAHKDARLSEDRRKELGETYAVQAVGLLSDAVRNGFKDVEELETEGAFNPLRQREDFKKLVTGLEAKRK